MVRIELNGNLNESNLHHDDYIDSEHCIKLMTGDAYFNSSHKDDMFVKLAMDQNINPLIGAAFSAYANHRPLMLSPDVIYNVIVQGLAEHVAKSPEVYRDVIVRHDGQKKIGVDFDANCLSLVNALKQKVIQNLSVSKANVKALMKVGFSTTTIVTSTVHAFTLMDIVKNYSEFELKTACAIPFIEIEGTKSDWEKIKLICDDVLPILNLEYWNDELQSILKHFISAFDNHPPKASELAFWNKTYSSGERKVTSNVTGWIAKLFLYIRDKPNLFITKNIDIPPHVLPNTISTDLIYGVPLCRFPLGLTVTRFCMMVNGAKHPMSFNAGFIGVKSVGPQCVMKPELGWVITRSPDM